MRRRDFLARLGSTVALRPLAVRAQQKPMPVIGWLHSLSRDRSEAVVAAFAEGLRDAGYIEGKNVAIEYRWADGNYDRLPSLAADLVGRKVDVILTGGGSKPILAAKAATATIPIVFSVATDPVGSGFVKTLARPGSNLTGISFVGVELMPKLLEILVELVPQSKVLAFLGNPNMGDITEQQIALLRKAANTRGVQLNVLNARNSDEINAAFTALPQMHADALVVGDDAFFFNQRQQIADLAARHLIPAIFGLRAPVDEAGGLISYGTSLIGAYRQSAGFVAKILAGANPADLPVQQPTKFELIINLKTAKALGLTVPQSLLARADEVIE